MTGRYINMVISIAGICFIILGIPLMNMRVKPNSWYGLRIPKTLANEKVWYEANRVLGRDLFFCGIAVFICGMVGFILSGHLRDLPSVRLNLAVLVLGVSFAAIHSLIVAFRS